MLRDKAEINSTQCTTQHLQEHYKSQHSTMTGIPASLSSSSPHPFRNLVYAALLAFSCTHAFVISSQHHENLGMSARIKVKQKILQDVSRFQRGGSSPSKTGSTTSQVNVLQSPPGLRDSTLNSGGDGDDVDDDEMHVTYVNGRSRSNGEAEASANGINTLRMKNGLSSSSALLRKGGFQEKRNSKHASYASPAKYAEYVAETKLPTDVGHFQLRAYRVPGAPLGQEPCVIYARDKPPMGGSKNDPSRHVPVRIHDQCLTSEVFRSQRCDCKEQLQMSLKYIQKHGGCIVYLQQEGRGIGLANKIAAYALQDDGLDTVDANRHLGFDDDHREYDIIPSILKDMNIGSIQLMTNNPRKVERLTSVGVDVERTLPMVVPQTTPYNRKYLETKKNRMNHSNFAKLLGQDAAQSEQNGASVSSHMMPQRQSESVSLAAEYINNGTEMSANAVQVSLMVEDYPEPEDGVKARSDGYCFGRESVEDAIAAMARGEMVVVVDDMDRENEGDFIMAADQCTPLDMAQIIRYSSGVICVAMEDDRLDELDLPPMVHDNQDPKGTAFTVTIDATKEHGITTGISASDRSTTIQMLANPKMKTGDFHRPGHILPLRARPGGVIARDGHTEAAVDLSRLAGRQPVGVLCEIVSEENPIEMMRLPEIKRFCKKHGYVLTSIVDIAQYRRDTESSP